MCECALICTVQTIHFMTIVADNALKSDRYKQEQQHFTYNYKPLVQYNTVFGLENAFRFTLKTPYSISTSPIYVCVCMCVCVLLCVRECILFLEYTKNGVCRLRASDLFAFHLILANKKLLIRFYYDCCCCCHCLEGLDENR